MVRVMSVVSVVARQGTPDELFYVEPQALHNQNSEVALRAYPHEESNSPSQLHTLE
jgi:hypothetical protein